MQITFLSLSNVSLQLRGSLQAANSDLSLPRHSVISIKVFSVQCFLACAFSKWLPQPLRFTGKVVAASDTPTTCANPLRNTSQRADGKAALQESGWRFWMGDWVVNICATFSRWTPLSCFPAFARALSVFRWTRCQGLCMSSSHACSRKISCAILSYPFSDTLGTDHVKRTLFELV